MEDASIVEIVRLQNEVGLKVITDGEFRRFAFKLFFDSFLFLTAELMLGTRFTVRDGASKLHSETYQRRISDGVFENLVGSGFRREPEVQNFILISDNIFVNLIVSSQAAFELFMVKRQERALNAHSITMFTGLR